MKSPAVESSYCEILEGAPLPPQGLKAVAQELLSSGRPFRFQARGSSMSPWIKEGDWLTLVPLNKNRPAAGKTAAFVPLQGDRLVVHRIVGKIGGQYLMKGDGLPQPDGLVPGSNLVGVVEKIERGGKKIRLGLGWERILVALLSRRGLLGVLFFLWKIIPPFLRRLLR